MDSVNEYVFCTWDSVYSFINPYKHTTIESVNDDADIENQYEKISKKVVVGFGNILTNLLILKLDFIKQCIIESIKQYSKYMEKDNEPQIEIKEKDE